MIKKLGLFVFAFFVLLIISMLVFYTLQLVSLSKAIKNSTLYLQNYMLPTGRFAYCINPRTGKVSSKYNIIRHAGVIYSMRLLEDKNKEFSLNNTKNIASKSFIDNYVKRVDSDKYIATDDDTVVKLGTLGLGLCALTQNSNNLDMLKGFGNAILFMQNDDGSFISKYNYATEKKEKNFVSLYYPGEACLGLLYLYNIDRQDKWILSAKSGLLYLATSNKNSSVYPLVFDHWTIIAIRKLFETKNNTLTAKEKIILQNYVEEMVNFAVNQQENNFKNPILKNSFGKNNLCSTATYIEGLSNAYFCTNKPLLKLKILKALYFANKLLIQNQIKDGKYRGGMPKEANCTTSESKKACKIRIDYVQHSMSAFVSSYDILNFIN